MAKRHMRNEQFYCCPLQELQIGNFVQIQNQNGHYPCWWTKTERVMETWGNQVWVGWEQSDSTVQLLLPSSCQWPKVLYTKNFVPSPPNSESLWQQPPEKAMDTDRDVNVASPSVHHESGIEEMEVDNTSGATEATQNTYTQSNPYRQDKSHIAGYEHQELCPNACEDNCMSIQVHTGKLFRHQNYVLMLNWIVWNRTVWLNWMTWNRNDFDN